MKARAEYIWLDGYRPTANIRSKTKVLGNKGVRSVNPRDYPVWGFDGSSTQQAHGHSSDCVLQPVHVVPDPLRGQRDMLVLCEVLALNEDGLIIPHESNTRHGLSELCNTMPVRLEEPWFGFEQEYTFMKDGRPLGFPSPSVAGGYPDPQGRYYCGAGSDQVVGRDIVEEHATACLEAGLMLSGTNAEVLLGQWEFQIGHWNPLFIADELILARWLLYRLTEKHGITATLHPKPVAGDWNGTGMHTNFSTKSTRGSMVADPATGKPVDAWGAIEQAIDRLSKKHNEHIAVYGEDNAMRLTGRHETCPITEFRSGVSDRGASIRIPWQVALDRKGYIEDRRPAANADPYQVAERILRTVVVGE